MTNNLEAAFARNQMVLWEPRKARKSTKFQSTEDTEQTEKPRGRAGDTLKNSMMEKDVYHE